MQVRLRPDPEVGWKKKMKMVSAKWPITFVWTASMLEAGSGREAEVKTTKTSLSRISAISLAILGALHHISS